MRRTVGLMMLAGSMLIATGASADTILLEHDFDALAPGVQGYVDRNLYLTTTFPGGVFSSVEIAASPYAVSAPNLVRPAIAGGALQGQFLSSDARLTLATDLLWMTVTGPQFEDQPYTISAFDRDGALLFGFSGWISQGWGFHRESPDIHSFIFQPGVPGQGLDDVRYTAPVVPEPTTLVLAATGLTAAWWRRRRVATGRARAC